MKVKEKYGCDGNPEKIQVSTEVYALIDTIAELTSEVRKLREVRHG